MLARMTFTLLFGSCWSVVAALPLEKTVSYLSNNQATTRFELRLAEKEPATGLTEATLVSSGQKIYVHDESIVTNEDVVRADAVQGNSGTGFSVAVMFSRLGSERLAMATEGHVGRPLAILVNGEVLAAPVLTDRITDRALITGDFTRQEAEGIAAELNRR